MKATAFFFIVLLSFTSASTDINQLLDNFILHVNQKAIDEQYDVCTIPYVESRPLKNIPLLDEATITLEGGSFKNLSTIRRTGEATLKKNLDSYTLSFYIGLNEATFHFDSFFFQSHGIEIGGMFNATFTGNSIHIQMTHFHVNNTCLIVIDDFRFASLGKLSLDFSPLSLWNTIKKEFWQVLINLLSPLTMPMLHKFFLSFLEPNRDAISEMICYELFNTTSLF